ncbi:sce7726 family protein [Bifidobacterium sp. ESL0784]|uniref:sce7726 family protein n=1 Tax=Bifidobacterium sp. ESL0784 TaxID=2983231 RepID=UPI0023F98376|nr:sce7726 family protein [Bifidobacterium sp. ESL0784]MDF7641311.1 sce7726 family protein [Bifidobacterium sp. ESL0784]
MSFAIKKHIKLFRSEIVNFHWIIWIFTKIAQELCLNKLMSQLITHDSDIRRATWKMIENQSSLMTPDVKILDELDICGEVRADIAVINGHLTGYELKSESDNLDRLPRQIEYYSKVMDYCNLVVAPNHLEQSLEMLPGFWGIYVARTSQRGNVFLRKYRSAHTNKTRVDPYSVVQFLWKDEALDVLRQYGLSKGLYNRQRSYIWERIVQNFTLSQIRLIVRIKLKDRQNWHDESNYCNSAN